MLDERISWSSAWRDGAFRRALIAVGVLVVPIAVGLPVFFQHIEAKPGAFPWDPLLEHFTAIDVTWLTFAVLYGTLAVGITRLARWPWSLVRGMHAYVLLTILRMGTLELVTLEPPPGIIPLVDPITQSFYPGAVPFLKDLFFSGHTATLALMTFLARGKAWRWITGIATVAIAALVVVQHVHWTVDVLAAPVFVWLAWRASAFSMRVCGAPQDRLRASRFR